MEQSGWVSCGTHTLHHPILAYLSDLTELRQEVERCREIVEEQLGYPMRTFAYPVVQIQHIGENVLESVKEAGYRWALTTKYGYNTPKAIHTYCDVLKLM